MIILDREWKVCINSAPFILLLSYNFDIHDTYLINASILEVR